MKHVRLVWALAALGVASPSFAQQGLSPGGGLSGGGGSGVTAGVTPILGSCTNGYFLYNNSGTVGCSASASSIALPQAVTGGVSGGIPYFSNTTTMSASAALAANAIVIGGGAGVAPSTTTTGTGVLTALGVNVGSAGAFVVNGGALGTPSSGTLTNAIGLPIATGVAGLGTNVAGALAVNTESTGSFTRQNGAITAGNCLKWSASGIQDAGAACGSGSGITIASTTITGGTSGRVLYDNAGVVGELTVTGSGSVVLATSPTLTTPNLGTPSALTLTNATGLPVGGISATGTPSSTTFLRGDGTWNTPAGGGNVSNVGTPTNGQIAQWTGATTIQGLATTGSGSAVLATSPSLTTPAIDAATGTSLNLNSATLGSNKLAVNGGVSVQSGSFGLSGNISSTTWGTSGIRYANQAATLTDTSAGGTVAAAYTDLFGGNTISASNARTFTNYYTMFISPPTAGANVTFTNAWGLGVNGAASINGLLNLGTAGATVGSIALNNATSGSITLTPTTGALGSAAITVPASTGTMTVLGNTTTGSGNIVLATSPTLTTPNLGTPSAATLTNATGLPIGSGVSGLGTGVATALGINTGTAGAFVVNGGALGTPSSGTLTNATGLPISTGLNGAGTGVLTALGVNVGSAGAFVVNGGALGTPSSGTLTNATGLPIGGITGLGTGVGTALGVNANTAGGLVVPAAALAANAIVIGGGSGTGPSTDASATLSAGALSLGASGTAGSVSMGNATSGTVTIQPVTGALGTVTASLPANTGTIAELNLAQSFSAAQTFPASGIKLTSSGGGIDTFAAASSASNFTLTFPAATDTVAVLGVAQTYSKQQNFGPTTALTYTSGGTTSWDVSGAQVAKVTMSGGNSTMGCPTNQVDGGTYILKNVQDTSPRTWTWNACFKWPGGTAPTISTGSGAVDFITFVSDGTNMYGVWQGNFQ